MSGPRHPTWRDGAPVLCLQDVLTPDGWVGFVIRIHPEEITVATYESEWEQEYGVDELVLVSEGSGS